MVQEPPTIDRSTTMVLCSVQGAPNESDKFYAPRPAAGKTPAFETVLETTIRCPSNQDPCRGELSSLRLA